MSETPAGRRKVGGSLEGLSPERLEAELDGRLRKVKLRSGLPTEKAAQVALIESGWEYWFKAVLRGVMKAAAGGRATREMRSFEKAITECGRLADPVKKLYSDLGVESQEDLERMVDAYRQAERHEEGDRLEAACLIIEAHLKRAPEDGESIVRRFGGTMGVTDEEMAATLARGREARRGAVGQNRQAGGDDRGAGR